MTDNRRPAEKVEKTARTRGNLGQKEAAREETADEKLEHMGNDKSSRGQKTKAPEKRGK